MPANAGTGPVHASYSNPSNPYHKIWINCKGSLNRHLCKAFNIENPFLIIRFPKAENVIRTIHTILEDPSLDLQTRESSCADHILNLLFDIANERRVHEPVDQSKARLIAIREYIDRHLFTEIQLEDIKKHFFISGTHLNRIFFKEYGITPHQYIIQQRINIACTMLRDTFMSISEIADQLNFSDAHYFSTTFKKLVGSSPTKYRKTMSSPLAVPLNQQEPYV